MKRKSWERGREEWKNKGGIDGWGVLERISFFEKKKNNHT